jgi:Family of unknown function (DUF6345)
VLGGITRHPAGRQRSPSVPSPYRASCDEQQQNSPKVSPAMTPVEQPFEGADQAFDPWAPADLSGIRCAGGWTSFHRRGLLHGLRLPRLRFAYRAPAHFVERTVRHGATLARLQFDEYLTEVTLQETFDSTDLLYLVFHGGQYSDGYHASLTATDWAIASGGFGYDGPLATVFDSCDLVDLAEVDWRLPWRNVGPRVRLIMGFRSQASIDPTTSQRGEAFAQAILAGEPLGPAWLRCASNTTFAGLDRPVVIGFGDDPDEAERVATTATLKSLIDLGNRKGPDVSIFASPGRP